MRFSIIIIITLFICCETSNEKSKNLVVTNSTSKFTSDSIFITSISSIETDKSKLYISDFELNKILVLDSNLKFLYSIGTEGRGPSELNGTSHVIAQNDSLIVYSEFEKKFNLYHERSYLKSFYLDKEIEYDRDLRFTFDKGNIYLSNINRNNSIYKLDLHNYSVNGFEEVIRYNDEKYNSEVKSKSHVLRFKKHLLIIMDNQPIIKLFNHDSLNITNTFSYNNIPEIINRIKFIEENVKGNNVYAEIVQDVYLNNNQLFILIHTNDPNNGNKWDCNTVLCFNLTDNEILLKNIYKFSNFGLSNIMVIDNYLYSFDEISGDFYKFDLTDRG